MNISKNISDSQDLPGRVFAALAVFIFGGLLSGQALAQFVPPPNTIGLTIEGCNNGGNTPITPNGTLPNADGRFVCQDPAPLGGNDTPYTPGNLGKDWSELDLVPHRLTVTNSGAEAVYNVQIAADYQNGPLGYDVITEPEIIPSGQLNGFSAAGCLVASTPYAIVPEVTGGAGESIYRTLTITHPAAIDGEASTCVVDFALRLAVGASGFPGASLQSYKFESADFQTGKATISLPVNEIEPQSLAKEMTATQDTNFAWNITKGPNPATLSFGDTCDAGNDLQEEVTIRVDWEILPGVDGLVMVVTNISATNPSSRVIRVDVSDEIFGDVGAGVVSLDTFDCPAVDVPANTTQPVCTHMFDAPADVTALSDTATASYIDVATGIPVPGQTTAMASAPIQPGTDINTTAVISDTESISGTGLTFTVDTTSGAAVTCNPTVPTASTTGPVVCATGAQTGDGFVEFNKTVRLDEPRITSGTLSDTATLTGSDNFLADASASVSISSNAEVELTIRKQLNQDILQGADKACFNFELSDTDAQTPNINQEICFDADDPLVKEVTIGGLPPDTYMVTETPAPGWAVNPAEDTQQSVDLNLPTCANTVTFNNDFAPQEFAHAQVQKVSDPAGFEAGWTFDLQYCADLTPANCQEVNYQTVSTLTTMGPGFEPFLNDTETAPLNLDEGTYRIGEVTQQGWDTPVAANCNDFVVDYPTSIGATFSCTYTNTKLGTIEINKLTDPAGGTGFGFTQTVDDSGPFTLDDGGTKTYLNVPAGTYTVTEDDPQPGYDLVNLVCTDGAEGQGYNVVDSSVDLVTREATINLDPGETVSCTYTNRQRGMVDLLKLTNGAPDPNMTWSFKLEGPDVNVGDSTPPPLMDFGMAKLIPGETYTLCETGIPPSWTVQWALDVNNNRIIDVGETLPFVGAQTGNLLEVYDPVFMQPGAVNDQRCVDFQVDPAETLHFIVDNQRPGGEPRTPGYWKNWNTCTGGNQVQTADNNGGPSDGWFLLDDLIPTTIGYVTISTCEDGVLILDHRDLNGRKRASDAAYNLARNLLAAKLNLAAGAETCSEVTDAVAAGDALLMSIGFDAIGKELRPKDAEYGAANQLAGTLDLYNNGELCQ